MQKRLGIIFLSFRRYSTKCLRSAKPVKLAFASYESTKNDYEDKLLAPIVINHGLFGSKNNWNSLSKAIHQNTKRKVITIDARNHGDSPHTEEMSYYHMAKDIIYLLEDLSIEKVILVGHSMGGACAMHTALNYPEKVEKLVVVDFSPVKVSPSLMLLSKVFEGMRTVNLEGIGSLTKARKLANEQMGRIVTSEMIRQFLLMNLVESESGEYKWRVNLPVLEKVFVNNIAKFPNNEGKSYNGPTLFLGGGESDYLKPKDHVKIQVLFPSANFHYISGAGHWLHAEKPTEFVNLVTKFVNEQ